MKRQPKKSLPGEPAAPNVARITRFKQDREFCGLSQRNRLLPSWDVVRLPAIAGADELHQVETVFGMQCFGRRAGEALHPGREPPEMLAQLRRTLGEYNFAGQYQQAPSPSGGGMVKAAWFKNYAANELPEKFDQIVQSWDTANKASELSPHPNPPPHAGEGRKGVHHLGYQGQEPLSDARNAPAHGISRIEAGSARAMRGVRGECRIDRGQGLGNPADPGIGRRGRARGHPLPAANRQGHADARADRDDRERVCLSAKGSGVARRIPARADGVPKGQASRPVRLDGSAARLVQARRAGAAGLAVANV